MAQKWHNFVRNAWTTRKREHVWLTYLCLFLVSLLPLLTLGIILQNMHKFMLWVQKRRKITQLQRVLKKEHPKKAWNHIISERQKWQKQILSRSRCNFSTCISVFRRSVFTGTSSIERMFTSSSLEEESSKDAAVEDSSWEEPASLESLSADPSALESSSS